MLGEVENYINNNKTMSTADLGGNRVLGMRGSLTGYINTGNQYNKNFYTKPQSTSKGTAGRKNKKSSKLKKAIGALAAIAISAGGIYAAYKTGAVAKIKNKISTLNIKKPSFNFKKTAKTT